MMGNQTPPSIPTEEQKYEFMNPWRAKADICNAPLSNSRPTPIFGYLEDLLYVYLISTPRPFQPLLDALFHQPLHNLGIENVLSKSFLL